MTRDVKKVVKVMSSVVKKKSKGVRDTDWTYSEKSTVSYVVTVVNHSYCDGKSLKGALCVLQPTLLCRGVSVVGNQGVGEPVRCV